MSNSRADMAPSASSFRRRHSPGGAVENRNMEQDWHVKNENIRFGVPKGDWIVIIEKDKLTV